MTTQKRPLRITLLAPHSSKSIQDGLGNVIFGDRELQDIRREAYEERMAGIVPAEESRDEHFSAMGLLKPPHD